MGCVRWRRRRVGCAPRRPRCEWLYLGSRAWTGREFCESCVVPVRIKGHLKPFRPRPLRIYLRDLPKARSRSRYTSLSGTWPSTKSDWAMLPRFCRATARSAASPLLLRGLATRPSLASAALSAARPGWASIPASPPLHNVFHFGGMQPGCHRAACPPRRARRTITRPSE